MIESQFRIHDLSAMVLWKIYELIRMCGAEELKCGEVDLDDDGFSEHVFPISIIAAMGPTPLIIIWFCAQQSTQLAAQKEGDSYRKLQSLEQRRDSLEDVILFHRWKGAFCLFVHCTHAILKKASNLHPERFYRAMLLVKSRWTHKRISLELPKLFPPSCKRDSRLRIAAKIVGMLVWKSVSITSIFVGIINVAWHFIHTWLASYPLFIVVYSQFYTLGK